MVTKVSEHWRESSDVKGLRGPTALGKTKKHDPLITYLKETNSCRFILFISISFQLPAAWAENTWRPHNHKCLWGLSHLRWTDYHTNRTNSTVSHRGLKATRPVSVSSNSPTLFSFSTKHSFPLCINRFSSFKVVSHVQRWFPNGSCCFFTFA